MNNLSLSLKHSGIGGSLGDNLINFSHLWYADDLCLIALSSAGMQKLLDTFIIIIKIIRIMKFSHYLAHTKPISNALHMLPFHKLFFTAPVYNS